MKNGSYVKNLDIISLVRFNDSIAGTFDSRFNTEHLKFLVISEEVQSMAIGMHQEGQFNKAENAAKFAETRSTIIDDFDSLNCMLVRVSRMKDGVSKADLIDKINNDMSYWDLVEPLGSRALLENIDQLWKHGIFIGNAGDIIIEKWICGIHGFSFGKLDGNLREDLKNYSNMGFPGRSDPEPPYRKF